MLGLQLTARINTADKGQYSAAERCNAHSAAEHKLIGMGVMHAQGHLDEARALSKQLPAEAKPLMLPAAAVDLYLKALEKHEFNAFAPQLQSGGFTPLWHQLLVKYNLMLGRF